MFDDTEIFRAGGDEFSVIVAGITETELKEKIAAIREASKHYDKVVFAIGGAVAEHCRDVKKALHQADELMYEDKNRYYEANPEKKRR